VPETEPPFPQVQNTERPDRVIAALMEGRVSHLVRREALRFEHDVTITGRLL